MESRSEYDAIAKDYEIYGEDARTDWVLGYIEEFDMMFPFRNKKILDYGCGEGKISREFYDMGAEVIGVDTSSRMIELAKEKRKGIDSRVHEYHIIYSGDLKFIDNGSLDYAVSNFVFCSIGNIEEIENIVNEVGKKIKTNGRYIVLDTNWETSNGANFHSFSLDHCNELLSGCKVYGTLKSEVPIKLKDYFWSKQDHIDIFESRGFELRDVREPVASGPGWLDETKTPPFYLLEFEKRF